MRHSFYRKKQTSNAKRSTKRRSTKRYSTKKRSTKRRSTKRQRSPKRRIKTRYNMRGMGNILSMYGQEGGATEDEIQKLKSQLKDLDMQLSNEKSAERREKIRKFRAEVSAKLEKAKEKLKQILTSAARTAQLGVKGLSSGMKSMGKKLSSGILSLGRSLKNKYRQYKERKAREKYQKLSSDIERKKAELEKFRARKSPSPSVISSSSKSSSSTLESPSSNSSITSYQKLQAAASPKGPDPLVEF